jgi:hypothetical protein
MPEAMTVAAHSSSINDYLARKRRYKKLKLVNVVLTTAT